MAAFPVVSFFRHHPRRVPFCGFSFLLGRKLGICPSLTFKLSRPLFLFGLFPTLGDGYRPFLFPLVPPFMGPFLGEFFFVFSNVFDGDL